MIYIAGSFSTKQERDSLEEMIEIVRKRFPLEDLYIPMEYKVEGDFQKLDGTWNLPNQVWAEKVYNADVKHIQESRMMFAMYLGRYCPSGTIYEIGYARGLNIPVIVYIPEWVKDREMSLMVLNGVSNYIDKDCIIKKLTPAYLSGFNQK